MHFGWSHFENRDMLIALTIVSFIEFAVMVRSLISQLCEILEIELFRIKSYDRLD